MAATEAVLGTIRAEMARRSLTQSALAGRIDMTQQALSARLAGRRPLSVEELCRIADVLGMPAAALLEGAVRA